MKHHETHPEYVEGCYMCRISTLHIGGTTHPGIDRPTFWREADRKNTSELNAYAAAVKEGQQPDSTRMRAIDRSKRLSDRWGEAYRGDDATGWLQRTGQIEARPLTDGEKSAARKQSRA